MQGKKMHVGIDLCVQLGQVFGWLSHFTRLLNWSGFRVGTKHSIVSFTFCDSCHMQGRKVIETNLSWLIPCCSPMSLCACLDYSIFSSLSVVLPKGPGAKYTYMIVGWHVWIIPKNMEVLKKEWLFSKVPWFDLKNKQTTKPKILFSCSGQ